MSAGVHFGEGRGATQGQGVGKPACGEGRGFYRAGIDTGGGGGRPSGELRPCQGDHLGGRESGQGTVTPGPLPTLTH